MKVQVDSKLMAALGRSGGLARWKGVTKAERQAHGKRLAAARWDAAKKRASE